MSHDDRVAERYARALFLIAERRGMVPEALDELQGLLGLVHADPRLGPYFRSPLVPLARKRALLRDERIAGPFPPVAHLLDLLLRKKRLGLLPVVGAEFETLVRRWQGRQAAEAVSAVPLTADQLQRLHARLERMTGLTLELGTRVEPELIGGLYVRIGDHIIDHSVQGLLASLQDRLFETSLQTG